MTCKKRQDASRLGKGLDKRSRVAELFLRPDNAMHGAMCCVS